MESIVCCLALTTTLINGINCNRQVGKQCEEISVAPSEQQVKAEQGLCVVRPSPTPCQMQDASVESVCVWGNCVALSETTGEGGVNADN